MSLAPTTKYTYRQGVAIYVQYCRFINIECRADYVIPPDNNLMLLFVSYLVFHRKLTYAGIKPYIYAVRHWVMEEGFKDPTLHHGKKWLKFQSLVAVIR